MDTVVEKGRDEKKEKNDQTLIMRALLHNQHSVRAQFNPHVLLRRLEQHPASPLSKSSKEERAVVEPVE